MYVGDERGTTVVGAKVKSPSGPRGHLGGAFYTTSFASLGMTMVSGPVVGFQANATHLREDREDDATSAASPPAGGHPEAGDAAGSCVSVDGWQGGQVRQVEMDC